MQQFFDFNILNLFSLLLIFVLFYHSNVYFKRGDESLWKKVLFLVALSQSFDILAWLIAEATGSVAIILAYLINILLFAFSTILSSKMALFLCYLVEGKSKPLNKMSKLFWWLTGLNTLLLVLTIPFNFIFSIDANNVYTRGSLYFLMITILLTPLIMVLVKLIYKYVKNYNKIFSDNRVLINLLSINLIGITLLIYLQENIITNMTIVFPFLSLSILLIHLILVSKAVTVDFLTKMQNKLGLELALNQIPKTSEEYIAAIFFDLDNFKTINDTYGHKYGDKILMDFANILLNETKNKNIVARIGGDEFLIVLRAKEKNEIDFISDSIAKAIYRYNNTKRNYKIEYSYGISINNPFEEFDKEALIDKADKKMYQHKFSKK